MGYRDFEALDMQRKANDIDQCYPVLKSLNIPPPALIENETLIQQQKRIMEKLRPFVAPDLQQIRNDDAFGTAHQDNYRRFLESAAQEAIRPSKVPEGELKEITRYDVSGRPYYEFYGSCGAWLRNFSGDRRKLAGIYNPDLGKFQKV